MVAHFRLIWMSLLTNNVENLICLFGICIHSLEKLPVQIVCPTLKILSFFLLLSFKSSFSNYNFKGFLLVCDLSFHSLDNFSQREEEFFFFIKSNLPAFGSFFFFLELYLRNLCLPQVTKVFSNIILYKYYGFKFYI